MEVVVSLNFFPPAVGALMRTPCASLSDFRKDDGLCCESSERQREWTWNIFHFAYDLRRETWPTDFQSHVTSQVKMVLSIHYHHPNSPTTVTHPSSFTLAHGRLLLHPTSPFPRSLPFSSRRLSPCRGPHPNQEDSTTTRRSRPLWACLRLGPGVLAIAWVSPPLLSPSSDNLSNSYQPRTQRKTTTKDEAQEIFFSLWKDTYDPNS